jgi:NifU-like protein involved in Fe-S cluster formation
MSGGDIYRETILDHYRNPRNKGRLSNQDVSIQDSNPLCGDEIEIHLKVEANMMRHKIRRKGMCHQSSKCLTAYRDGDK